MKKNSRLEQMLDEIATNVKDLSRDEIRNAVKRTVGATLVRQMADEKRQQFRKTGYAGQVR